MVIQSLCMKHYFTGWKCSLEPKPSELTQVSKLEPTASVKTTPEFQGVIDTLRSQSGKKEKNFEFFAHICNKLLVSFDFKSNSFVTQG